MKMEKLSNRKGTGKKESGLETGTNENELLVEEELRKLAIEREKIIKKIAEVNIKKRKLKEKVGERKGIVGPIDPQKINVDNVYQLDMGKHPDLEKEWETLLEEYNKLNGPGGEYEKVMDLINNCDKRGLPIDRFYNIRDRVLGEIKKKK
ncbi:MAG: hypothetical protein WCS86_02745 [Candidatus Paceibacterota bacterium]